MCRYMGARCPQASVAEGFRGVEAKVESVELRLERIEANAAK